MKLDVLTNHARSRMQQRGIPPLILDWLQIYGSSSHDHRGAEIRYFDPGARRRIAKDVGQKVVDLLGQLLDAYMGLCCTNQKRAEITPTPDAATPQQARAPLPGAQVV